MYRIFYYFCEREGGKVYFKLRNSRKAKSNIKMSPRPKWRGLKPYNIILSGTKRSRNISMGFRPLDYARGDSRVKVGGYK